MFVLGAEGDEDALAGVRVEGGADERIVGVLMLVQPLYRINLVRRASVWGSR